MPKWDVIIVGAGPAGLMAAAAAAGCGARTLLLEKGRAPGRKLLISGGGRCNLTNRKSVMELIEQIPGNGPFLFSALSSFGSTEIIQFFHALGIRLKEEEHGRMFPATDKAATVLDGLIRHIRGLGVSIRTECPVQDLVLTRERCAGVLLGDGQEIHSGSVVVAVGGQAAPQTGSTGDGYAFARRAGHTITPLYPVEVPLTASDPWIRERVLQGLSLQDVLQTLWDERGRRIATQRGDMLFTHFGLSGPASLRMSHYVSAACRLQGAAALRLTIDLFADRSAEQLAGELTEEARAQPKRAVKNLLKELLPERLISILLQMLSLDEATPCARLQRTQLAALSRLMKEFPVTITGTLSFKEAFVTGGGVNVKEVDPKSMHSRKKAALFFAGEVLDLHGHTGGYNITIAFSTGYAAGKAAAEFAAGLGQGCIERAPAT